MILPLSWTKLRPGCFIPVFFLLNACFLAGAQPGLPEAASAALGGAYVTLPGFSNAGLNQACLGASEQNSLCIQHSRPYLLKELGLSSLSAQLKAGTGTMGLAISTQGIKGLRQSSLWLSYGMGLHPDVLLGLGIHFWNSSMAEKWIYNYGVSFATGLRVTLNPSWMLGFHVKHPVVWNSLDLPNPSAGMSLAAGFSYSFLRAGILYSEIHVKAVYGVGLVQAIEWSLGKGLTLSTGVASNPLTCSWGISFQYTRWSLIFAFQYRSLSGTVPLSSIGHVW